MVFCSFYSVPLGADEKEVREESEEERIWNLLKEQNRREERRQNVQKALEREWRKPEKLGQERVIIMSIAQFPVLVGN